MQRWDYTSAAVRSMRIVNIKEDFEGILLLGNLKVCGANIY